MKKQAQLIAIPYKSKEPKVGQLRLGDDRVISRIYQEDLSSQDWYHYFNTRTPVCLILVAMDNDIQIGDKFISPKCYNESLSDKIFTYVGNMPELTGVIAIESESGEEMTTAKYLLKDSKRIIATHDQIPFENINAANLTQDLYFENDGICQVEMDGRNASLINEHVVLSRNDKNIKLQIIYTLEKGQELANFEFRPEIIQTRESFIDFCLSSLKTKYSFATSPREWMHNPKEKETPRVVKLSGCIYLNGEEIDNVPSWWTQENGKVYFNDDGTVR